MSKHTPGPWTAVKMNDRHLISRGTVPRFQDGLWFILPENDPERLPIAVVDAADDNHAPSRAKAECEARLIAAAPDLLEALRTTQEDLCSLIAAHPGSELLYGPWLRVVDAAIAKAEGRSCK